MPDSTVRRWLTELGSSTKRAEEVPHVQRILSHSQITTTAEYVKVYIGRSQKSHREKASTGKTKSKEKNRV